MRFEERAAKVAAACSWGHCDAPGKREDAYLCVNHQVTWHSLSETHFSRP